MVADGNDRLGCRRVGFDRVAVRTFRGVAWKNFRPLIGFLSCYGSLNPGKRRQFSCTPFC
jgi:hypothetical protein